jgi:hypothetical protein
MLLAFNGNIHNFMFQLYLHNKEALKTKSNPNGVSRKTKLMMAGSSDIEGIAQYLAQTLHPSTRKQAEANLAQLISKPQFAPILLELLSKHPDDNVKFSAAVYFKNFIKRKWKPDGDFDEISPQDREQIKQNIINIMTTAPNTIILQLSEAVTLIANTDFPDRWGSLLRVNFSLILGYYWKALLTRSSCEHRLASDRAFHF